MLDLKFSLYFKMSPVPNDALAIYHQCLYMTAYSIMRHIWGVKRALTRRTLYDAGPKLVSYQQLYRKEMKKSLNVPKAMKKSLSMVNVNGLRLGFYTHEALKMTS